MPVRTSAVVAGGVVLLTAVGIATLFGDSLLAMVAPPAIELGQGKPRQGVTSARDVAVQPGAAASKGASNGAAPPPAPSTSSSPPASPGAPGLRGPRGPEGPHVVR